MARNARRFGIKPPAWVKTSLAPGSPAAQRYLSRSGLLQDLEAIGFGIVGFGCTTCVGNSGSLTKLMDTALLNGITATAVLSGNRNFRGRIHPHLQNAFLASPPMVIAYALAGDVLRDITCDPLGESSDGRQIYLSDLWPDRSEVETVLAANANSDDYSRAFQTAGRNAAWEKLASPDAPQFPWDESLTYIRRPPFASADQEHRLGAYAAYPLLVLGDDMTTDHISPAGQIPKSSVAGIHLIGR
ncbi:aconitase family protein [Mesorhizobium sp. M0041]|uniref:aconitase family protein n=1 Tax=Mesorhizobium sp. M0041 TaxID=2956856 RepID=UPI0033385CAE